MTEHPVMEGEPIGVGAAVPDWQLPRADSLADAALNTALSCCAHKMGVDDEQVVVRLRQGDGATRNRYHYDLAKQIAETLGKLDESIKAVYVLDYDATPEDLCFCEADADPLIHLIVWTQRRTPALNALAAAVDRALVQSYRDLVGAPQMGNLLDVQVVDDADVQQRTGYGALFGSIHHRPITLWERQPGL